MFEAVSKGDRVQLAKLLDGRRSVNFQSRDGSTPLHLAVYLDNVGVVDDLLKSGADPGLINWSGLTPLMAAANSGKLGVCEKLIQANADVRLTDKHGNAPLSYAITEGPNQARILEILIANGAEVNKTYGRNPGCPPLFGALSIEAFDLADILLRAGAKIDVRDGNGNTVDYYLSARGREWLEKRGISIKTEMKPGE